MIASRLEGLSACGKLLDNAPNRLGELRRTSPAASLTEKRERLEVDGYLFLPGFLDRDRVIGARLSVLERLRDEGLLHPDHDWKEAVARPNLEMAFRPDLANGNPVIAELLYGPELMGLYSGLFGEPAGHYDYTWLRAMAPGQATPPHYDIVYMGRGTHRMCTAWVPLSDIPYHFGGLMVLENSHQLEELRQSYGTLDVDTFCENQGGERAVNFHGYHGFGALTDDPRQPAVEFDRRWLTAEFQMGDLLTFSMFTLHAATDNRSEFVRLSTDSRYQPAAEPFDERWIGEHPVGHGPGARRDMIC